MPLRRAQWLVQRHGGRQRGRVARKKAKPAAEEPPAEASASSRVAEQVSKQPQAASKRELAAMDPTLQEWAQFLEFLASFFKCGASRAGKQKANRMLLTIGGVDKHRASKTLL